LHRDSLDSDRRPRAIRLQCRYTRQIVEPLRQHQCRRLIYSCGALNQDRIFCLKCRGVQGQCSFPAAETRYSADQRRAFSSYAHQMQGLPHLNHNLEDLSNGSSVIGRLGNTSFRVVVCSEIPDYTIVRGCRISKQCPRHFET
jgi:hypothetical protein